MVSLDTISFKYHYSIEQSESILPTCFLNQYTKFSLYYIFSCSFLSITVTPFLIDLSSKFKQQSKVVIDMKVSRKNFRLYYLFFRIFYTIFIILTHNSI